MIVKKLRMLEAIQGRAMTSKPSSKRLAMVPSALSETEGRTLKQIHEIVGVGARPTVSSCLRILCADERARHEGPDGDRVYFRT
jgi:hypothetical protein